MNRKRNCSKNNGKKTSRSCVKKLPEGTLTEQDISLMSRISTGHMFPDLKSSAMKSERIYIKKIETTEDDQQRKSVPNEVFEFSDLSHISAPLRKQDEEKPLG